eukprot:c6270_g1_i1.p1 GENE.c6270_g1_i1~~c6270_g1_i1.p1  ORF type:complete len:270 (-),score=66.04 c6270_g1_i1:72-857(-)
MIENVPCTLIDTHSHIHISPTHTVLSCLPIAHHALMSIDQSDWEKVLSLHTTYPATTSAWFGVHPWHVRSISNDWIQLLEQKLNEHPQAMVGEIGLDKVAAQRSEDKEIVWKEQLRVFREQYHLAGRLNRSVSIHCVQGYGELYETLRKPPPPAIPLRIGLHSYGGSLEITKSFLSLPCASRLFFGFSFAVSRRSPKIRPVIAHIPIKQILLESDSSRPESVLPDLQSALLLISEIREIPIEETARILNENAKNFLGLVDI